MIGFDVADVKFDKTNGLVCVVVQDQLTLQVLMVAWMDRTALNETIASGEATFYSRSRQQRWRKGETSGNRLIVKGISPDCDSDALLLQVEPLGPACHTGAISCFGATGSLGAGQLGALERTISARAHQPSEVSRTTALLESGTRRIAQKVGEEAVEVALAAIAGDDKEVCEESADLLYHLLVLLRARGLSLQHVSDVLATRAETRR